MRRPVLAWVFVALLLGCTEATVLRGGVQVPLSQAEALDFAEAERAAEGPDLAAARVRLERYRRDFPRSARSDTVLFLLADVNERAGDLEGARAAWRELIERYSRSPRAPEARYRLAWSWRQGGRVEFARQVLREADFARASEALRARSYRLLADLARDDRDYPDTVLWLAYARREASTSEVALGLDLELAELVEERLFDRELAEVVDEVPPGPARDRILLELADRALRRGDADAALAALERLPRALRPAEAARRERLLARARVERETAGRVLGVAVPLSGRYRDYGEAVLRGLALGLEPFGDPPGPYLIHIRDTAGDPERAAMAVRELASLGVSAIIGPLRSPAAAAAAPLAYDYRIPLLTLARQDTLPFLGQSVFRLGLTAADQARVLVEYAMEVRGQRTFAVLYPGDAYGREFKNVFWDEVEARGGEIVGVESYPPDAVDHQEPIRRLVGLYYVTPEEAELIQERDRLARRPLENSERLDDPNLADLPPHVDFDALFIPDAAPQVGLILPQLRYYDVRDVLLLGPSGWNDPRLLEIAGSDARGAVFTDVFFSRSRYPAVQEFVGSYYDAFGTEPERLAAQAYDIALLLRELLEDARAESPEELRVALAGTQSFAGVSGVTSLEEGGGTKRALYLLTVRGNEITEIEPLP
ncbi:MAG: penicillin-binding protein activator [Myxococcota bacterium]|nr:penicillin-binding protein activator [Myxococcota bacterium]